MPNNNDSRDAINSDLLDSLLQEFAPTIEDYEVPLTSPELTDSVTKPTPCILLIDTSSSTDNVIHLINEGLQQFLNVAMEYAHMKAECHLAIITFGSSANLAMEFTKLEYISSLPTLTAGGTTAIGAAVNLGLDLVDSYTKEMKSVPRNRIQFILVSDGDGAGMDDYTQAAARCRQYESDCKVEVQSAAVYNVAEGENDSSELAERKKKQDRIMRSFSNLNACIPFEAFRFVDFMKAISHHSSYRRSTTIGDDGQGFKF